MNGTLYSTWGIWYLVCSVQSLHSLRSFCSRTVCCKFGMTIFNSILLIGYYLTFLAFMFVLKKDLSATFQISWALCLPLISDYSELAGGPCDRTR